MKRIALVMGAALAWPLAANADISYDYIQVDWIADGEIDGAVGSADYDGFAIEGSALLHPNVFVTGKANFTDVDSGSVGLGGGSVDVSVDTLSIGPGLRMPLATGQSALDLYGTVTYEEMDLGGLTSNGFGVDAGLRWQPMPGLEINPNIGYVDYGEFDGTDLELDGERYGVRGIFNLTDNAAVVVDYRAFRGEASSGGDSGDVDFEDEIHIGARWNFM